MIRVKLIRSPRGYLKEDMGILPILPFGISLIASHLNRNGYYTELEDLDIKVIHDRRLMELIRNTRAIHDQDQIEAHINGKEDKNLRSITDKLLEKFNYKGFDLFGFSIGYTASSNISLLLAKDIKEDAGAKIVFGGPSVNPDLIERYDFIDYIISGGGELSLLNLCKALDGKIPVEKVPSLVYKKDGKILKNFLENIRFIDRPVPDYSSLDFWEYRAIPLDRYPFSNPFMVMPLPYSLSTGCPHKCSFCSNSVNKNPRVHIKPPKLVVKEITEMKERYNNKHFMFLNEYINLSYNHVDELCDEIIGNGLDIIWSDSARADNLDNRLLKKMRKVGCISLAWGIESGSDRMLEMINKKITAKQASKILKWSHDAGIWNYLFLITGFPHETRDDFNKTLNFVKKNLEYIDQINPQTFRLSRSEILLNPEKFGIKVLSPVGTEAHFAGGVHAFDEINGLSWNEKRKESKERLEQLISTFYKLKGRTLDNRDFPHMLYYLYNTLKSKKMVIDWIKKNYEVDAIIFLGSQCNNNCIFCDFRERVISKTKEEIRREMEFGRKTGRKRVFFIGGEPTIRKDIIELILYARKLGFEEVRIRTNGRMLYYRDFAERLIKSGVKGVTASLCGHDTILDDNVTRASGSFKQSMKGIENWKGLGGRLED